MRKLEGGNREGGAKVAALRRLPHWVKFARGTPPEFSPSPETGVGICRSSGGYGRSGSAFRAGMGPEQLAKVWRRLPADVSQKKVMQSMRDGGVGHAAWYHVCAPRAGLSKGSMAFSRAADSKRACPGPMHSFAAVSRTYRSRAATGRFLTSLGGNRRGCYLTVFLLGAVTQQGSKNHPAIGPDLLPRT